MGGRANTRNYCNNVFPICVPPKGTLTDARDGDGGHLKKEVQQPYIFKHTSIYIIYFVYFVYFAYLYFCIFIYFIYVVYLKYFVYFVYLYILYILYVLSICGT